MNEIAPTLPGRTIQNSAQANAKPTFAAECFRQKDIRAAGLRKRRRQFRVAHRATSAISPPSSHTPMIAAAPIADSQPGDASPPTSEIAHRPAPVAMSGEL